MAVIALLIWCVPIKLGKGYSILFLLSFRLIDCLELETVKLSADQITLLLFDTHFASSIRFTIGDWLEIIVGVFFLIMPALAAAIFLIELPKYSL